MTTRRRLTPGERRRLLVEAGAELFAAQPYESVLMEDVAAHAGVSRALLYKHFPNKRDLFAAVYAVASEGLLAATELDRRTPFLDQLIAGLGAHFDYFAANRSAVLAANRTLAGDPVIQAIVTGELAELRRRVIEISGLEGHDRAVLAAVLTSWLVFVRVLVVDWLANDSVTRDELNDICVGAARGALGDLLEKIEHNRLL
ncbi:TetR/AcrR family transcriptional regulator [Actinoplanes sp. CA-142083]|uniref:TetR/AcrR family transcriptional regulator n=1 Tax=Actinoplanes sp. CA-142083 TaxID=3239903 RepID=UPI003D92A867